MRNIDENRQIKEQINKIIQRSKHLRQTVQIFLHYIQSVQQSYSNYGKKASKQIISFENKIMKASFYSTQKTNQVRNLAKVYRQFTSRIQKTAKVNLYNIGRANSLDGMIKCQDQIKKKNKLFQEEFQTYNSSSILYNKTYTQYLSHCSKLNQIILKFQLYSDPLLFYNKTITSQYQDQLQKQLNQSKNNQTKLYTDLQLLDSKHRFLQDILKDIRQNFTSLLHSYLKLIQNIVSFILDPSKQQKAKIQKIKNQSQAHSQMFQLQFQRLNTFNDNLQEKDQILIEFGDLFKNCKQSIEVGSQHRFFYDRCQQIKNKKTKAYQETLNLHYQMVQAMERQESNYKEFDKNFKEFQTQVFTLNGKESYKKRMRAFFGQNTFNIHQLTYTVIQKPKKAIDKLSIIMKDHKDKFIYLIQKKKQALKRFNKIYSVIMADHLKLKQKIQQESDNPDLNEKYRKNIKDTLNTFKRSFNQLDQTEKECDQQFVKRTQQIYKLICKQGENCNINKIIEKETLKMQILRKFTIDSQALKILKEDSLYTILFSQHFTVNLYKSFQSQINQTQYSQAKNILKEKEQIAKKMLKKQVGCCGLIKAKPIQRQIISQHKCSIYNKQNQATGIVQILKEGVIFQSKSWNPFSKKVHILIPDSDIKSCDYKQVSQKDSSKKQSKGGIVIQTAKGPIYLLCENSDAVIEDMSKTINFRTTLIQRKGGKNSSNNSTSIFKQLPSSSIIVSYNKKDKSFNQTPVNQNIQQMNKNLVGRNSKDFQGFTSTVQSSLKHSNVRQLKKTRSIPNLSSKQKQQNDMLLKKILLNFNKTNFFSKNFTPIQKAYKSDERKDYSYQNLQNHSNFLLKQLKNTRIVSYPGGKQLQILFDWKVSYPATILQSFKHNQKVIISVTGEQKIQFIEATHKNKQIFNRYQFYKQIRQMNNSIYKYIIKNTQRQFIIEFNQKKQEDSQLNNSNYAQQNYTGGQNNFYPDDFSQKSSAINNHNSFKASTINFNKGQPFKGSNELIPPNNRPRKNSLNASSQTRPILDNLNKI